MRQKDTETRRSGRQGENFFGPPGHLVSLSYFWGKMGEAAIDTDAMKAFAREYLARHEPHAANGRNAWRQNGAARWAHTLRVLATAQKIARAEGADYDVVTVAAIFHDVAKLDSEQDEHALRGAEIARDYLTRAGFSADWIARACQTIVNHPAALEFGDKSLPLEDRILRDADLLDEVGALEIVWTVMNAGVEAPSYVEARTRIAEYDRKTAERTVAKMMTRAGRKLAEQRLKIVNDFIAQLDEEMGEGA